MGRERKPQSGATNLSTRHGGSARGLPPVSPAPPHSGENECKREDRALPKSLTQQLIAPELFSSYNRSGDEDERNLNKTATWLPQDVPPRDFETIHRETYQDPQSYPPERTHTLTAREIAEETIRRKDEVEAINNMCKLVRASYGTVATMLRSFHKKPGDTLTLYEFGEYLKRNKLDHFLPHTDRERIFNHVQQSHNGELPVNEFLKKVEEYEFLGQENNQDLQKVRDFLQLQLHAAREREDRLTGDSDLRKQHDAEFELSKQQKGVENELERMQKALGMKTYSLDFDHKQLDDVLASTYTKLPTSEAQRKYARYLHHSNLKLSAIPFYETRSTEIDRLKARAVQIDRAVESESVLGRFEELHKTRWLPSTTLSSLSLTQSERESAAEQRETALASAKFSLSRSLPNLAVRASPLAQSSPPSLSVSLSQSSLSPMRERHTERVRDSENEKEFAAPQASSSPVRERPTQAAPITTLSHSEDATLSLSHVGLSSPSLSLHGAKSVASLVASLSTSSSQTKTHKPAVSKLRTGLLDQEEKKIQPSDFLTQVIDASSSMGRLKNPAAVFRIEKIDPLVYQRAGKRVVEPAVRSDWSCVGNTQSEREQLVCERDGEEENPYMTTNSRVYPPLVYEPSQPVARDVVSDAEREAMHKKFIRSQRFARKNANLEVTKTRLEYEALQKEIRSMRRQQARIEDNIRYKTNVLLEDLQAFRSMPLQRMAKRQNMELAERMWGGSHDKQTVELVRDERDFASTYNSSFDANVVRETVRSRAMAINDQLHGTHTHDALKESSQ